MAGWLNFSVEHPIVCVPTEPLIRPAIVDVASTGTRGGGHGGFQFPLRRTRFPLCGTRHVDDGMSMEEEGKWINTNVIHKARSL